MFIIKRNCILAGDDATSEFSSVNLSKDESLSYMFKNFSSSIELDEGIKLIEIFDVMHKNFSLLPLKKPKVDSCMQDTFETVEYGDFHILKFRYVAGLLPDSIYIRPPESKSFNFGAEITDRFREYGYWDLFARNENTGHEVSLGGLDSDIPWHLPVEIDYETTFDISLEPRSLRHFSDKSPILVQDHSLVKVSGHISSLPMRMYKFRLIDLILVMQHYANYSTPVDE